MATYIVNENELYHGVPWRKHKYIRKEGNRYIYPEDLKNEGKRQLGAAAKQLGKGLVKAGRDVIKQTRRGDAKDYWNSQIRVGNQIKQKRQYAAEQRKKYGNTNNVKEAEQQAKALSELQKSRSDKRKVTSGDKNFKSAQDHAKKGASYIAKYVKKTAKQKIAENKLVKTSDGQTMTAKNARKYEQIKQNKKGQKDLHERTKARRQLINGKGHYHNPKVYLEQDYATGIVYNPRKRGNPKAKRQTR